MSRGLSDVLYGVDEPDDPVLKEYETVPRTPVTLTRESGTHLPHTPVHSRPRSVDGVPGRVLVRDTPRTSTWSVQRSLRVPPEATGLLPLRHRVFVPSDVGTSESPHNVT